MSLNTELADLFSRLASLMDLKGEAVFKAIAFQKVARLLESSTVDLRKAVAEGTLKDIEGIGASSRRIIEQYVTTGRSMDYDEVAASVPAGLIEMLSIPGLGPKTIALFWKQRGVTTIDALAKALDDGTLGGLKGVGEKKLEGIRQGLAIRASSKGRIGIWEADPVARSLLEQVRALPRIERAEVAGSLRRRRETIGDVDIVASLRGATLDDFDGSEITAAFTGFSEVKQVLGQGPTKASILTHGGMQVDLRIVPPACFGAALLYFTGSKEHNVAIRGRAQQRGLTLNEWGLYDEAAFEKAADTRKPGYPPPLKAKAAETEEAIYQALGLVWITPELREDRGEVAAAEGAALPALIDVSHIRADLHTHTTASDGQNSIEEMAQAAKDLGYTTLAITDHSKSQVIANGLTPQRLLKHIEAIRKASDRIKGITLLAGAEVDILVDGRMDYEDAVLAELDWVVASPHASLKQDPEKATARLLRAIENRYVNVIGHPSGRLIGSRTGLQPDWNVLFKAAAQSGTALEINAGYPRLDLSDTLSRAALDAGCTLCIDTDAHSVEGLAGINWGIDVARRAWTTPDRVLNCRSTAEIRKWVSAKR